MINKIMVNDYPSKAVIVERLLKESFNGEYVKKVCLSCGVYWVNIDANTNNVKCVNNCANCIKFDK